MKAYFLLPYHNSGAHFAIWSVYYLAGKTDYVPDSNQKNIHAFKVNYYTSLDDLDGDFEISFVKELNPSQPYPVVAFEFTEMDIWNSLYNDRNPRSSRPWLNDSVETIDDVHQLIQQQHFDFSFDHDVWDQREKIALYIHHYKQLPVDLSKFIDLQRPHLLYNTDDLWNGFDIIIDEIFEFLGIELLESRRDTWLGYYHKWRPVHKQYLSRHLDQIVDAIVNNKYMSLKRFKVTLLEEALILNRLIVEHNLNLKSWELSKFPDNTQDLYKLLEPSQHKI